MPHKNPVATAATNPYPNTQIASATELKHLFDVIDEFELAELAQVDVKTVRQWRTRRIGPMYISAGKARLYFKNDVLAWMRSIRKETSAFDLGVLMDEEG